MSAPPKRGSVHPFAAGWLQRAAVRIETAPIDELPALVARIGDDLQRLRACGAVAPDAIPMRLARALLRRRVPLDLVASAPGSGTGPAAAVRGCG